MGLAANTFLLKAVAMMKAPKIGWWSVGAISCPTPTRCATVDDSGYAATHDGIAWSRPGYYVDPNPEPGLNPFKQGFTSVSCYSSTCGNVAPNSGPSVFIGTVSRSAGFAATPTGLSDTHGGVSSFTDPSLHSGDYYEGGANYGLDLASKLATTGSRFRLRRRVLQSPSNGRVGKMTKLPVQEAEWKALKFLVALTVVLVLVATL
jgi:hypothetical protein